MKQIAESFTWPFRGRPATWAWGIVSVLLLPLMFVPLLGYAVASTRAAGLDPAAGPPPWRFSLGPGAWLALALTIVTAPFALLLNPLAAHIQVPLSFVLAGVILALPWGMVVLLLFPHATASFAATGRPADLFNVAESLRAVRRDFATWNAVVAAIVTAWAIGLACAGLLCVGLVPGVFYAILVSAHAAAALHHPEASRRSPPAG